MQAAVAKQPDCSRLARLRVSVTAIFLLEKVLHRFFSFVLASVVLRMLRLVNMSASDSTGLGCCWFGSSLPDGFAFCRRLGVTYVATPAGKGLSLVV